MNKRFEWAGDVGLAVRIMLRILTVALMIFLLWSGAHKAYYIGYSVFNMTAMEEEPGEDVVVTILADMSDYSVGKLLESKGLISDSFVYVVQAQVYEFEPEPGTYLLNTSDTLTEMMSIMTENAALD